jgi:hypothetical protein
VWRGKQGRIPEAKKRGCRERLSKKRGGNTQEEKILSDETRSCKVAINVWIMWCSFKQRSGTNIRLTVGR